MLLSDIDTICIILTVTKYSFYKWNNAPLAVARIGKLLSVTMAQQNNQQQLTQCSFCESDKKYSHESLLQQGYRNIVMTVKDVIRHLKEDNYLASNLLLSLCPNSGSSSSSSSTSFRNIFVSVIFPRINAFPGFQSKKVRRQYQLAATVSLLEHFDQPLLYRHDGLHLDEVGSISLGKVLNTVAASFSDKYINK